MADGQFHGQGTLYFPGAAAAVPVRYPLTHARCRPRAIRRDVG
jgi:hypothetical protein